MAEAIDFIEPLSAEEGVHQAVELFTKTYGYKPAGVWSAPGRVNLIGEHTDYNAGLCLPIALPHRTYIAVAPAEGGSNATRVRVVSTLAPQSVATADLSGLQARGVKGWAAYPIGVAWALRQMGFDQVRGFDAAFSSCVPLGSGLSSSAAMTCSTALALDDVFSLGKGQSDEGRLTLIQAAVTSENDMAGASTGGLDQSAAMRCSEGHSLLLDFRPGLSALESATSEPFDLTAHHLELLVVDTQAPHSLNDGQYAQRRATCEKAATILGAHNLREVSDTVWAADDPQAALADVLAKLPDETMRKRVRHVITEIGRVPQFVSAFANGDVQQAGRLMNASGDSLRDDYEVTIPELDVAVDVARREGALGARMVGGGFGGSIIALVPAGQSRGIAQKVADEFARRGFHAPRALSAVASRSAARDL
jgi:galactokinase